MNKQQLAAKIWSGANDLRGKVSASSYKDYMLGLIFYKYLSNKEETYLKEQLYFSDSELISLSEDDTKTVENCKNNIGYFISYKDLFSTWVKSGNDFQIIDVRTALSAFNRNIGKNYLKVYDGIFDTLQKGIDSLGTVDGERTKAVRKLTTLINEIPTDDNQSYDVLGFVYEFLLKNFAANAGKAGEFYTPYEASYLMSEIISNHLKDRETISIYDPTSGSGSLLINIGKTLSKHVINKNKIKYYAQELIENTYNLTRMNLIMRDILPNNIVVRNGDTLADDWPFFDDNDKENTYDPVFVDAAISNPPYSQAWNTDEASSDVRFSEYGVAPKGKADYAFLLHSLYHLKPDGIMTIVLPHGVLFRGGEEAKIREKLVETNKIEAIIGMPSNMFFGTGIPTIIMVLKKNRKENDILFVDASKNFIKDGNKNRLQAKDVRKIVDSVINRESIDKFSRLVSKEEIVKNGYNLNIPRYVNSSSKPETWDIYSTMYGGIPNYEIDELNDFWNAFPSLREELFEQENIPYSKVKNIDVETTISNNKDVKEFFEKYNKEFSSLPEYLKEQLIDNNQSINISKEEYNIAEILKNIIKDIPLVDYYDSYQILDNNWNQISLDLELIQAEGIDAVKKVDPNMVYKKTKNKEVVEVQDGWIGHILPFDLIQNYYYHDDKEKLNDLIKKQLLNDNKKKELIDSIDPVDKAELLKEDSEEIDSKKLNSIISKLKKEIKMGAEFEYDSYENTIIQIDEVNSVIREIKKEIKTIKVELEENAKTKILELSDDEAKELLIQKWIVPLCNELTMLPQNIINDLKIEIEHLEEKYSLTYKDISTSINQTKKELVKQLDSLVGDKFDIEGIKEFKNVLGGEEDE